MLLFISKTIYPPPTSIIFFGTLSNFKAPVDETIIFSSISIPGKEAGTEPVAITVFSDCINVSLFFSSLIEISFYNFFLFF